MLASAGSDTAITSTHNRRGEGETFIRRVLGFDTAPSSPAQPAAGDHGRSSLWRPSPRHHGFDTGPSSPAQPAGPGGLSLSRPSPRHHTAPSSPAQPAGPGGSSLSRPSPRSLRFRRGSFV